MSVKLFKKNINIELMKSFQEEIREIQRNPDFSTEEKSQKIRELMKKKNETQKDLLEKNKKETSIFKNNTNIICNHYQRGCEVKCNICDKFYPCRLCHDQFEDHKLDRFTINTIRCKRCKFIQTPSQRCQRCQNLFGFYYCQQCRLWEFKNKCIFHCDKCGICRIGKKQDYIHCDKCNMCILKSHYLKGHKCVENSTKSNCPVCNEYMFDSVDKNISILKCGHSMHQECLNNLLKKKQYQCPLCKKSVVDMKEHWLAKDQLANLEIIPMSYLNKRLIIFCNDCEKKSDIKFSFEYRKCTCCGGYNTNEVELYDI